MTVLFVLLVAAVAFAVVALALGRGGLLDPELSPSPQPVLPDGPVEPADLAQLRFEVAPRGYRMDQVDAVLSRLERELASRDARIAALENPSAGEAV
jgi:DivIVA domain-containing protein